MEEQIDVELETLVEKLPRHVQDPLRQRRDLHDLLEVVLDLGRTPEARFPSGSWIPDLREISEGDLQYVIEQIGPFGDDNRAGIERTLHRISAIRNRTGKTVGLTLRVGRAVYGTIRIIEDLVVTGKSIVLVGRPGVGKTTMLREVARVLADDARKRTIVVDTSNEIAGDGDIPHPGIGRARRMQVPTPDLQHAVMIEAVENHMPEVIVIDEIGTENDADAARTIAERGVQLVATAHGNTLENLIMNPTLSDLVGGVHTVTLGDVEARRRRSQKTVLERRAPPTFDILVEIQGWNQVAIHSDVAGVVDRMLRGLPASPELRSIDEDGGIQHVKQDFPVATSDSQNGDIKIPLTVEAADRAPTRATCILPYGLNKDKLRQAARNLRTPVELVGDIDHADLLVTTKNYYRRRTQALRTAEQKGKPVYVLRKNTVPQIEQFMKAITRHHEAHPPDGIIDVALQEAEEAASRIERGEHQIKLNPQGAYVRRIQHQVAEKYGLASSSTGRPPTRSVVLYRR